MKGLFIEETSSFKRIYNPEQVEKIGEIVDIYAPPMTPGNIFDDAGILNDCEIIFTGWGAPCIDEHLLSYAPNLKIVFYGAGSVKKLVTDASWEKGVRIVSAWGANAVPVSEYTLSQILWNLKRGYAMERDYKKSKGRFDKTAVPPAGAYKSTVGLISLGMIARKVCELLKHFEMNVIAYDPFVSEEDAKALGAELVSLEEVFIKSDVVSLHTPWLPETVGMITGEMISSMKKGSTFINTARGAVIKEEEMIAALQNRNDIQAVLDVTYPEPPADDSPLWTMENVVLTPHIAGSMTQECNRHAQYMIEELERYLKGEELIYELSEAKAKIMA